jgi:2,4-dienoyl-CoA reductase-like NADH-dependent reductase (Old Yellow Enzyme family)
MILPSLGFGRIGAFPPQDGAFPDAHKDSRSSLARFVEKAHQFAVPVGMQLNHPGVQGDPGALLWGPSERGWRRSLPARQLTDADVRAIVARFARSAYESLQCGFDFIELHAGHGYLLHSFLSPRLNDSRTGDYAGTEGGVRLAVEVIDAIRQQVGDDLAISLRVSGEERIAGGLTLADMRNLLPRIAAGVDLINVSGGAYGSDPVIVATYDTTYGYNSHAAAQLRDVVDVPVLSAGRVWDPDLMQHLIDEEACDLIGLARALWADPELPNKVLSGVPEDVRPSIGCNQGCIDRLGTSARTCLVNPFWATPEERSIVKAERGVRVAVVGAGPAGLEAARVASLRGHEVTIYEKEVDPGGTFRLAARVPGKQEFGRYLTWQMRQLLAANVSFRFGTEFAPSMLETDPADVVIMATGASWETRDFGPVIVRTPTDAMRAPWSVTDRVIVVGADQAHFEAALFLSSQGRQCEIYCESPRFLDDMGLTARSVLLGRLREAGIPITKTPPLDAGRLPRMGEARVTYVAGFRNPRSLEQIGSGNWAALYWIGDAHQPRSALEAVADGASLALTL